MPRTTKRNLKLKKEGGAFMGEGTYGCVFAPSIPCKGYASIGHASKVFSDNGREVKEEMASSAVLSKIDPKFQYFFYPFHSCKTDYALIKANESQMAYCNKIDKRVIDVKNHASYGNLPEPKDDEIDFHQVLIPRGTTTIYSHVSRSQVRVTRQGLARLMRSAFEGVEKLIKHGMCHQDIKPLNIVIVPNDPKLKFTRLIDFGLMKPFDDVYSDNETLFNSIYAYSPPEYRLVSGHLDISVGRKLVVFRDRKDLDKVFDIETSLLLKVNGKFNLDNVARKASYLELWESMSRLRSESERQAQLESWKAAEKSDVYSLGVSLLECAYDCVPEYNDNEVVVKLFNNLVRDCLNPHPLKRISIKKAIRALNVICNANTKIAPSTTQGRNSPSPLYDIFASSSPIVVDTAAKARTLTRKTNAMTKTVRAVAQLSLRSASASASTPALGSPVVSMSPGRTKSTSPSPSNSALALASRSPVISMSPGRTKMTLRSTSRRLQSVNPNLYRP